MPPQRLTRLNSFRTLISRARPLASTWGFMLALALASLAYLAVIGVSIDWRLGNSNDQGDQPAQVQSDRFPGRDYDQRRFPPAGRGPLIGMNYTHYAFPGCRLAHTGVVDTYHEPGVARRVHRQLLAMRKHGLTALRTIMWHITDASAQRRGTISSAQGKLHEPQRTNLIRFLKEVKRYGFERFTMSFSPQGPNNPLLDSYDPSLFQENWRYIRSARRLLKRYGPRDTKLDILTEGAPSKYMPPHIFRQLSSYVRRMYARYVSTYGNRDVSVSVITAREPRDKGDRLQNLIDILKSTGLPLPRRYDINIGYTPAQATHALRDSDLVLRRNDGRQQLIVSETAYNNRAIARVIAGFITSGLRPIDEVSPWFLKHREGCNVGPPYSGTAYKEELQGLPRPGL